MDQKSVAQRHTCVAVSNTPDQLGEQWVAICDCGHRTAPMLHLEDMTTLMVLHGMDVERAYAFERTGGIAHDLVATGRSTVRRDRPILRLFGLSRDPAQSKGPQAPPRHFHPEVWSKS